MNENKAIDKAAKQAIEILIITANGERCRKIVQANSIEPRIKEL